MSREFARLAGEYFTLSRDALRFHYYKMLLRNEERMQRYQLAIEQKVTSEDTVLEIGSGLGTLTFMAARKAKKVYAVEKDSEMLELSREIAKRNGIEDKIEFIEGNSFDVTLPEKATVLLMETFGDLALEYNLLGCVLDSRRRNLKTSAKFIPKSVDLYLFPFHSERIFNTHNGFWQNIFGIDHTDVKIRADNLPYMTNINQDEFIGNPQFFLSFDLQRVASPYVQSTARFSFVEPRLITGFAGFFETRLSKDNIFSTRPGTKNNSFRQYCFPLPQIVEAQEIEISLENNPHHKDEVVSWNYEYRIIK